MENSIYRFRRLEQLLGNAEGYKTGFDELRKQTIYFSLTEHLNDPMEGFKDIFWSGDEIIWKNLLLHYLMCLERIFILFVINGENDPIKTEHIPVEISSQDFPTQEFRELHKRISQKFFSSSIISEYPRSLASRTNPIRRNEFFRHLQMLHTYALKCIYEEFVAAGLMMPWSENDIFANAHDLLEKAPLCDVFNQLEQRHPNVSNGVEKFMEATSFITQQQAMITQYNAAQKQSFFQTAGS